MSLCQLVEGGASDTLTQPLKKRVPAASSTVASVTLALTMRDSPGLQGDSTGTSLVSYFITVLGLAPEANSALPSPQPAIKAASTSLLSTSLTFAQRWLDRIECWLRSNDCSSYALSASLILALTYRTIVTKTRASNTTFSRNFLILKPRIVWFNNW